MNIPIMILIVLAFYTGVVFLQIFLSKRESKWLGLILPVLSFLIALIASLGMVPAPQADEVDYALTELVVFLIANIPTVILLAIYFACREKMKRKRQLDKMNIQDLE